MELVFKPLLAHHFPTGTSVTIYDKDSVTIYDKDTTTLEDMYEDDPSLDELRIVTRRTICGNISDEAKAMLKPLGAEYFDTI